MTVAAIYSLRFDPQPALDAAKRRFLDRSERDYEGVGQLARFLGVDPGTVHRWRRGPGLTVAVAEQVADNLGLLPSELWPDYWDRVNEFYEGNNRGPH